MTGAWALTSGSVFDAVAEYRLQQNPSDGSVSLSSVVDRAGRAFACDFGGRVTDPRGLTLSYSGCSGPPAITQCGFVLRGEADASLQTISGVLACDGLCGCRGQQKAVTLTRK